MIANKDAGVPRRKPGPLAPGWGQVARGIGSSTPEGAMASTREWILQAQSPEGYWHGEHEGDTILESEYVLLMTFLGRLVNACAR